MGEYRDVEQWMYLLERFIMCEGVYGCRVKERVMIAKESIAAL